MADVSGWRMAPIGELCEVGRARDGETYPAGTCYVTLSAAHDNVGQLPESGPVEARYAVLVPREGTEPDYLKVVLDRSFPSWLVAHRTGINLQFSELSTLAVEWHDDAGARREVMESVRRLDALAAREEATIAALMDLKAWLLLRMFA